MRATPPRLTYFVHGRGRGHAARARGAVPELQARGFDVRVLAAGDALQWLPEALNAEAIALIAPGQAGPTRWARRVAGDVARLRALRPQALVSDGDGPSLIAARTLGVPSVAVGHGLVFGHAELPRLPRLPLLRERINAASSGLLADRRVAVHFLPTRPRDARTQVARPDFPTTLPPPERGDFALCYFRDDNGQPLLRALLAERQRLGLSSVRCFGSSAALPGVDGRPLDPIAFRQLLPRARVVLGSGGSNLLAECVHLRKPLLCQYAPGDAEQALNAALAEAAGVAVGHPLGADPQTAVRKLIALSEGGYRPAALDAMQTVSEALFEALSSLGVHA